MNSSGDVVAAWLDEALALALVTTGDRNHRAIGNMLAFSGPGDRASGAVAATLLAIADVYGRKVAAAGLRGTFYAWVDEQASQLRCSFCSDVDRAEGLPFGCVVREQPEVTALAARAVTILSARELPAAAFDVGEDAAPEDEAQPFVLDVWCVPVPR